MQLALAARLACFASAIVFCASAYASGTDDAVTRATRMAYHTAMRCFIANGHASGERQRAGDTAKVAYYEAKARQSFDAFFNAGVKLGQTDDQIDRDLDFAQRIELPRLLTNPKYLLEVAGVCKAVGLM